MPDKSPTELGGGRISESNEDATRGAFPPPCARCKGMAGGGDWSACRRGRMAGRMNVLGVGDANPINHHSIGRLSPSCLIDRPQYMILVMAFAKSPLEQLSAIDASNPPPRPYPVRSISRGCLLSKLVPTRAKFPYCSNGRENQRGGKTRIFHPGSLRKSFSSNDVRGVNHAA